MPSRLHAVISGLSTLPTLFRIRVPLPPSPLPLRIFLLTPDPKFDWRQLLIQRPRQHQKKMPKVKSGYYAVKNGKAPGIYTTWDECEAQVKGFPKAAYKKFPTRVAAEDYIGGSRAVTSTVQPATTSIKDDTSSSMTTKPLSDLSPTAISAQSSGYTVTPDSHLVVWTDGSAVGNGKVGSVGGLGVYWGRAGNAAQRNLAEALPGPVQTNNRAELLAIIRALETNPYPDLPLEIRTDSKYSISCLTIYLPSWLRNNFRTATGEPVKNQDMIVHLIALLNRRGRGLQGHGLVRFKHVRAHVGIQGNEEADRLANVGSAMPRVPERTNWLSLMDAEHEAVAYKTRRGKTLSSVEPVDVEVEVDPSWLLDETEMQELDRTQAF